MIRAILKWLWLLPEPTQRAGGTILLGEKGQAYSLEVHR